jgi:short-subunit dehydrogenase
VRIQGRLVVVTGASSGIGAATARALAEKGARRIVLVARSEEKLAAVADEVRGRGSAAYIFPFDLANTSELSGLAAAVRDEAGDPDILINNAGAGRWMFLESTTPDEILEMTAVPYLAAACLTAEFLPAMLARREGHVVNLTSPACFLPWPGASAYAVARWAMRGLSETLEADLTGTGVDVSLVAPGKVSSGYFEHNPGSEERIPGIGRLYRTLTPDEVARHIVAAIERRRRLVVRPRLLQLTVWWGRHFPWMVAPLVRMSGVRR